MQLIRVSSYEELSRKAADIISAQVILKPGCVLGLATGSTPVGTYRQLIERFRRGDLDFSRVTAFNLDEYLGISPEHPQSYHAFMQEQLFRHINICPRRCHVPEGCAEDPRAFARAYDQAIAEHGGIDLQLLGIGNNGHIAFNEPGSSLTSRTRMKTLTQDTIIANSRFFGGDVNQVPKTALTVGVGTVCDAREVLLIVNGHNKARALQHGVEGAVSQMWTISALQLHPHAIIVADDDACAELKVATYRYFKDIERDNLDPDSLLK